jgi:hypothetical protein
MKNQPTNTIVLAKPMDILNRHLHEAMKPHAAALREAAAIDRELSAEMEKTHPDLAKREANQLLESAANGDAKAEAILREAGGTAAFIANRCALFDLARSKHEAACKRTVPLWQKVSASVLLSFDAAHREIQAQWKNACEFLGEPCGDTAWDRYCHNLRHGIERTPHAAENMRFGADWQLTTLGLKEAVGL